MRHIKNIIHIQKTVFLICVLMFASCSIDNVQPRNQLLETTVITDETSAVNMLNRIYNAALRTNYYGYGRGFGPEGVVEFLTTSDQYITYTNALGDYISFSANQVVQDNSIIERVYRSSYNGINVANFFIELVERGDANVTPERQIELLAEARALRGFMHFNLLRVFGQFYDLNSEWGIVASLTPLRDNTEYPRNSVQEVYSVILADLQFAADNAVSGRAHYYMSATTARALLAKVQLYSGDFTNAAANAQAVINNTDGYGLDASYSNIFATRYGSETLLAAFIDGTNEGAQGNNFLKTDMEPAMALTTLADAQDGVMGNGSADFATGYDPRFSLGFGPGTIGGNIGKYPNGDFLGFGGHTNVIQILRMGELYLIYAEAEARRSGGSLTNALARLNDIRNRASVTPKTLSDQATLLEDIKEEKVLELYAEAAEHWFDLVRYHTLGNINALTVKPTLTSTNQFILPFPENAILGNSLLQQNPQ